MRRLTINYVIRKDTPPVSVETRQGVNSVTSRVMWQNNGISNQTRARYAIKLVTSQVDVFNLTLRQTGQTPN